MTDLMTIGKVVLPGKMYLFLYDFFISVLFRNAELLLNFGKINNLLYINVYENVINYVNL